MDYQVLPYDVLVKNLKNENIMLTDELFFAITECLECGRKSALFSSFILEVIRKQGIDVKGWRCERFDNYPQVMGLITPNWSLALCYVKCP